MGDENFLHLKAADLDKWVYRIMPFNRLVGCMTYNNLTLVKPKLWDDPFENYLLSATVRNETGELGSLDSIRNAIYGQCWTRHRETDAMWRIYSAGKDGVRVRSTPRKLLTALQSANSKFGDITCFIGRVQYHHKDDLLKALNAIRFMESSGAGIAESLLHKRKEFAHENEIRLIYNCDDKQFCANSDIYQFAINPNDLFEQAIFDPRMDRLDYLRAEAELRRLDYRNKVGQSVLYRPPPDLVIDI